MPANTRPQYCAVPHASIATTAEVEPKISDCDRDVFFAKQTAVTSSSAMYLNNLLCEVDADDTNFICKCLLTTLAHGDAGGRDIQPISGNQQSSFGGSKQQERSITQGLVRPECVTALKVESQSIAIGLSHLKQRLGRHVQSAPDVVEAHEYGLCGQRPPSLCHEPQAPHLSNTEVFRDLNRPLHAAYGMIRSARNRSNRSKNASSVAW
ncbi:hypothetical protein ACRQ1B_17660 [Rhizobium panacihumi]